MLEAFKNLDFLSVGVTVAAIGILGFIVFFNNRQSITNRTFLAFAMVTILYGAFNYANYQVGSPHLALWLLRLTIFFAVWHAFCFFQLFFVFPQPKVVFPTWYSRGLVPLTVVTSIITLTPWVFKQIAEITSAGRILKIINGPGMVLFGALVMVLVTGGMGVVIKRAWKAIGPERKQFRFILIGVVATFSLLLTFNLVLPAVFDNAQFVPLGALFMLPFVIFTFYAIVKHKFLKVKIVATEMLAFGLAVISLFDVIVARDLGAIILKTGVFSLVLAFGILLIRSVLREVEQREKLEILTKELEAANTKLKELDRLKSEFLSFASHQVKAPMAVVKGFATLIYDGTYGSVSSQIKETAKKIKDSADRMIALVNNILNLRKIEEGRMEYHFEELEVIALIAEIVDELRPLAVGKQLDLSLENNLSKAMVWGDREKLRQSFQNLIENAIKYTENGEVKVKTAKQQNYLVVKVSDSGRGMDKELLPRLFEQFNRDNTVAKKIEGTGLGLYIAKQFVVAHRGEIGAESPGERQGSTFVIKLPLLGN